METRISTIRALLMVGIIGLGIAVALHLMTLVGIVFPQWLMLVLLGSMALLFLPLIYLMRSAPIGQRKNPVAGLFNMGGLFSGTALWRKLIFAALGAYVLMQACIAGTASGTLGMLSSPVQRFLTAMAVFFYYTFRLIVYAQSKRVEEIADHEVGAVIS